MYIYIFIYIYIYNLLLSSPLCPFTFVLPGSCLKPFCIPPPHPPISFYRSIAGRLKALFFLLLLLLLICLHCCCCYGITFPLLSHGSTRQIQTPRHLPSRRRRIRRWT